MPNDFVFPQDVPDAGFPNGLRREGGLTIRDLFAMGALSALNYQNILTGSFTDDDVALLFRNVSALSYRMADAMLAERAR